MCIRDSSSSDQKKGMSRPPVEKEISSDEKLISLTDINKIELKTSDIKSCFINRKSSRSFTNEKISFDELSFLLWSAQGVREVVVNDKNEKLNLLRTVPSAGSRHPFELYFAAMNVESLSPGIYKYVSSKHSVVLIKEVEKLGDKITERSQWQKFCGDAPLFLLLSVTPYRTVWRYQLPRSLRVIAIDVGHVGQNIHLACEALGLGTCMVCLLYTSRCV